MAERVIEVSHSGDVGAARRFAREAAIEIGFDAHTSEEVALAVSELATNLVKHAGGGTIAINALAEGGQKGIEIVSQDYGPGFRDTAAALRDGTSTTATLGYGLGAVNRLMDTLEISSLHTAEGGARIVSRRWLNTRSALTRNSPLEFGVVSRPHPLALQNGDSFVIVSWGERTLVGVIDGLGHGEHAHRASATARQYIEAHHEQPLERIFAGVGRACLATRGVVMALALFAWEPSATNDLAITLSVASIGNVEVRMIDPLERIDVFVRRGILGLNAPPATVTKGRWGKQSLLVMHSDGLSSRWRQDDFRDLWRAPAAAVAQGLMNALGKETDDATVLVGKGKAT